MGMFDDLKQPQLQEACRLRELSAAGSNAELIARLEQYEAEMLLGGEEDEMPPEPPVPAPTDPPASVGNPGVVTIQMAPPVFEEPPKPVETAPEGPFTVAFPCSGELSTGMHEDFRMRAYNTAIAKGKLPRGGLAAAHRIAFRDIDGTRCAIYEVMLRK